MSNLEIIKIRWGDLLGKTLEEAVEEAFGMTASLHENPELARDLELWENMPKPGDLVHCGYDIYAELEPEHHPMFMGCVWTLNPKRPVPELSSTAVWTSTGTAATP